MKHISFALGACLVSAGLAAPSSAAPVLDQSGDLTLPGGPSGEQASAVAPIIGGAAASYFQTLTIGTAGQLTGIGVQVGVNQTPVENLTATIYGTNAGVGGDPFTPDTSTVLGTATVQPGLTSPSNSFEMFDVVFNLAAPIAVAVGDKLALGLTSGGTTVECPSEGAVSCQYNWGYESMGYAGGNAFNTNPISGAFQLMSIAAPDFGFSTVVDSDGSAPIPLPATLPLLAGTLGVMAAVRRRLS